eukprot:5380523-Amphidinium_carterae.1
MHNQCAPRLPKTNQRNEASTQTTEPKLRQRRRRPAPTIPDASNNIRTTTRKSPSPELRKRGPNQAKSS